MPLGWPRHMSHTSNGKHKLLQLANKTPYWQIKTANMGDSVLCCQAFGERSPTTFVAKAGGTL